MFICAFILWHKSPMVEILKGLVQYHISLKLHEVCLDKSMSVAVENLLGV
jgi:hypothetical protein